MKNTYNAFSGVFVPTFLSVIGVILYLRLGFIVGSAGILGAITIIILSVSITLATGLSLSSITSNIRISNGGAYSIISQVLGLEVGGSVGIPLYLAQIFSVVLYMYGFGEVWQSLFPSHSLDWIVLLTFGLILLITSLSTKFAVRTQMFVFGLVVLSLISVVWGGNWLNIAWRPDMIWNTDASFWNLFALFFPAVTGLMAGVGMSGDLSDPKKQIPKGVITGLGVSSVVYIIIAVWYGNTVPFGQLIRDPTVIVQYAAFSPIVLMGILAATFSSALTTTVAAPRVLLAMGEHKSLPFSDFFAATRDGEPVNATLFTGLLIVSVLPFSSLNTVAPLLTMFFLITYLLINIVIYIEKSLGLPSFRPTFEVPGIVSLYGAIASVISMFLINALAGAVAIVFLAAVYLYLVHKNLTPKEGDVRSGLLRSMSEWAAKKIRTLPESPTHIWKPNILVPVQEIDTLLGIFPFVKSLIFPHGTVTVLGIVNNEKDEKREMKDLQDLVTKFHSEGIFTSSAVVTAKDYTQGVCIALQALSTNVFTQNTLLFPTDIKQMRKKSLEKYFHTAKKMGVGLVFFKTSDISKFGSQKDIHVWIPSRTLKIDIFEDKDSDLALLLAYELFRNWKGNLTTWMCVKKGQENKARYYMKKLLYEARFSSVNLTITIEKFRDAVLKAQGDIHIIPVNSVKELYTMKEAIKDIDRTFLFVADSGREDVTA